MKLDNELLQIWKNHSNSTKEYWEYNDLSTEEKSRLFDLLKKNTIKRGDKNK